LLINSLLFPMLLLLMVVLASRLNWFVCMIWNRLTLQHCLCWCDDFSL
jgi:hypothetical protein